MTIAIEAAARLACRRLVAQGKPLIEANVMAEIAGLYVRACLVARQLEPVIESQRTDPDRSSEPPFKAKSISTYAEILGPAEDPPINAIGGKSPTSQNAGSVGEITPIPMSPCTIAGQAQAPVDPWVTRQQANADLDLPALLKRA